MEYTDEIYLNEHPTPAFINQTEIILSQMKNNICQVCKNNAKGTGFFCKIPLDNKKFLPVFITNYHVIDEKFLKEEKNILLLINNGKKINTVSISLTNKFYYINKRDDITIVEIKQNTDNINYFLELDENILNDPKGYVGNTIYTLHYPSFFAQDKAAVSYGIIKEINQDYNHDFYHYCCTTSGSSGSPILNLSNNKIIGVHKSASKKFNIGSFLRYSLKECIDEYNKREKGGGNGENNFKILTNLFYSYECMNKKNLESCICTGTNTTKFELSLKNDGTLEWHEKTTKLLFIKNDRLKMKDDNIIGEKLILKIKVKEKEDPNAEMNKHMEEIEELREEYGLSEDQYTNKIIFDALQKSGFEIEEAFVLLIPEKQKTKIVKKNL